MNTDFTLGLLFRQFEDIHFLNLVSEPLFRHGRVSFHAQDIRTCDLPERSFDVVTCLSTIEHVGGDNSYNEFSPNGTAEVARSHGGGPGWPPAWEKLLRLVKPDGLLLVRTPFGAGCWRDGEYEFGPSDVAALRADAGRRGHGVTARVFGKDAGGWRFCSDGTAPLADDLPSSRAGSRAVLLVESA
jgi:hypothetical protein